MSNTILSLIIERRKEGKPDQVWGRMKYQDDLMVDYAKNEVLLIRKMKMILKDFYSLDPESVEFDIKYDISTLFRFKPFLNISGVALEAGINPGLMRQYVSGIKNPSSDRVKKIQGVINHIGNQLRKTKLTVSSSD
jgi:hypothetical protein